MLGFIAVLVIVGGGIFVNNFKGSLLADSHGFIERAYQYARATEIIMQFYMVLEQVLDIIFVILKMYHKYTLKTFETPSLLLLSQNFINQVF